MLINGRPVAQSLPDMLVQLGELDSSFTYYAKAQMLDIFPSYDILVKYNAALQNPPTPDSINKAMEGLEAIEESQPRTVFRRKVCAHLCNAIGMYYYNKHDYQRATIYLHESARIYTNRATADSPFYAENAYKSLVNAHRANGTLQNYEQTQCQINIGSEEARLGVHLALGAIYKSQGSHEAALSH